MPGFVYSCISNVQERYKEELRHCSFSQGAYSLLGCLRFMPKSLKKKKTKSGKCTKRGSLGSLPVSPPLLDVSGFIYELLGSSGQPSFEQSCPVL